MEIMAHIGNLADLKTSAALRSTCRACLAVISKKRFILYDLLPEDAQSALRPLRQLNQISIEFKNVSKQSAHNNLPIFEELSHLDIHSLNITDFKYVPKALSLLAHLPSLECLELYGDTNELQAFTNLTRLKLFNSRARLNDLNIEDLHFSNYNGAKLKLSTLTRLVVDRMYSFEYYIDKKLLCKLKFLTVRGGSNVLSGVLLDLTALESLTTDTRVSPAAIAQLTLLTRLELSKNCFGNDDPEDLASYAHLTRLKVLNISEVQNKFAKSISFMSKLPLVSATISGMTRDDGECIQYFKPHLLTELCVNINNTSMFKHALTRLTRLDALKVISTTSVVVGGIDTLTRLTRLVLVKSQCQSVESLTRLKVLHADLTSEGNMSGWTALTHLNQLEAKISTKSIKDVVRLTQLSDLALEIEEPFAPNALSGLTNLTRLCLPHCNYETLDWLTPLTRLQHLDLKGSKIGNPAALIHLTNLTKLVRIANAAHIQQ